MFHEDVLMIEICKIVLSDNLKVVIYSFLGNSPASEF